MITTVITGFRRVSLVLGYDTPYSILRNDRR